MVDVEGSIKYMSEEDLYEALGEIEGAIYVMERWGLERQDMYEVRMALDKAHLRVLGIDD